MWHERAETMVKLITQADGEVFAAPGDIADPRRGRTRLPTVRRTLRRHRHPRQRRGRHHKDLLDDTDLERWNRILAVNLTADFLTIKQAVKRMRPQHYGRIVNVSSIAAKHGGGYLGGVAYAATKAGVAALTRGAAREYAPDGINVNAVMPGLTYTPMTADMPDLRNGRPWKRPCCWDMAASHTTSHARSCSSPIRNPSISTGRPSTWTAAPASIDPWHADANRRDRHDVF